MIIESVNTYTSNKTILQVVNTILKKLEFKNIEAKKAVIETNPIVVEIEIIIKSSQFKEDLAILEQAIDDELEIVFGENNYGLKFKLVSLVENE